MEEFGPKLVKRASDGKLVGAAVHAAHMDCPPTMTALIASNCPLNARALDQVGGGHGQAALHHVRHDPGPTLALPRVGWHSERGVLWPCAGS